jgi:tRNA-dihydrouridine synthase
MFAVKLQSKINFLKERRPKVKIGSLCFEGNLFMAPLAAITTAPFRIFMQELGASVTVSELVSCHGINYENEKTLLMLKVDPREKNTGLQLFGENALALARAAAKGL